jgi:flavin-dependent dehydrogenase
LNKQEKTFRYDVVVLGGGPAGTATVLSLRQHAPFLSLALIEQTTYTKIRIGETLPPIAQPLLEQLGVWNAFLNEGHVPAYGSCSAWGSDELLDNEFIYHPTGRGWHLDRRRFDALLAHEAASAGVTLYTGSKFITSRLSGQKRWRLTVHTEHSSEISIESRFVVDATGRRAVFASQQGVRKVLLDQLLGVFVFFSLNGGTALTDTYTLVEAWEEGWWYSALVPDEKLAVACMSDKDIVKKRRLNSSAEWFELMNETRHIKDRVQEAQPLAAPSVHAASSHRLERITGDAWLAVGDAATTLDPLSSLGVFKGLRSGIMASYAIGDYFKGSSSSLEKYEAILAREFEEYLRTRADYYGQERRWADSPFWQRRYDQITLDPRQILRLSETASTSAAVEKLSMHLPVSDLKYLCQMCTVPRQAQEIVSEFKARRSSIEDRRIILALQYLVEEGLIQPAAR